MPITNEMKLVGVTAVVVSERPAEWEALVRKFGLEATMKFVVDLLASRGGDVEQTVVALGKACRMAFASTPADRKAEALRLKKEGFPTAVIARKLGVSRTTAHKMVGAKRPKESHD
ncbi:MAG TPA: helix-turn-helix domain-containing protein [Gemmataceae bacterium]|jgi:DNA-directed RNA polymerase specialized sigma24 family protein|nr:helix-turn-helix domain-containing protein [Gemmataceae bacterium]